MKAEFLQNFKLGDAPLPKEAVDAILAENGIVNAAPALYAGHIEANLIHEAAIGKIAGEQLIKLMTLGLTEKEAEEQIVNGFLK